MSSAVQRPYSINLMWINKSKSDSLLPEEHRKSVEATIRLWEAHHTGIALYFWYDGDLVSGKQPDRLGATKLRNVRDLTYVKENPEIFAESVEVYVRVDLLKGIIGEHLMETETQDYIFTDLDVTPLSQKELRSKNILDSLDDMGIVMQAAPGLPYENSFLIFNREHKLFRRVHREVMIEGALQYLKDRLEFLAPGTIYFGYSGMLIKFFSEDGRFGAIQPEVFPCLGKEPLPPTDREMSGAEYFSLGEHFMGKLPFVKQPLFPRCIPTIEVECPLSRN